jgi:hypothetical protein
MVKCKWFAPTHLSVNLTNACQLDCPYCSNADRDKAAAMPHEIFVNLIRHLQPLGLQAVTLTGGGEPTLHPDFHAIVTFLYLRGIKVGLITNGVGLADKHPSLLDRLDWIRISIDGHRKKLPRLPKCKKVSFSWVWEDGDDQLDTFKELVRLATAGQIGHLRVGSNIYKAKDQTLPWGLSGHGVIIHDRRDYAGGAKRCWTGLIWPKVDVDGKFMACCGHQYAMFHTPRKRNDALCLGNLQEYLKRVDEQAPFNGERCERCYYSQRNAFLEAVKAKDIVNPEFI